MKKYKNLKEKKLNSQTIYKGVFLEARVDNVELPDKTNSRRFFIIHPGAAVIVAEARKNSFLVIEQYRYSIGKTMLEFPAGKRDPKEPTAKTAKRELLEETGYAAAKVKKLGPIYPCIGYSTECIDVYYARNLKLQKQHLDEGEFLNVFEMTEKEIDSAIKCGKITDAKTLSAWMLYKLKKVRAKTQVT
jgi:ADP-ribose pyrophosphatase